MNTTLLRQASAGALALTLLAACKAWTDGENFSPGVLTAKGVIFSAEQINQYPHRRYLPVSVPHWTPTAPQAAHIEEKLPGYLRGSEAWQANEVLTNLDTYTYQYIGYTNAGRKMIWVNGFCPYGRKIEPMWQSRPLMIADGGPCFFKVHYDPATETFERLFVHGPV